MASVRTSDRPAARAPGFGSMAPSSREWAVRAAPGSQQALGLRNRELVLESLVAAGPATQAMLARSTGLSAATVSNVVNRLRREGRVRTDYTVSTGRRAVLVQLKDVTSVAAGVELADGLLHAVLLKPDGHVLARSQTPVPGLESTADLSEAISRSVAILLDQDDAEGSTLGGAGVATSGPAWPGPGSWPDGPAPLRFGGETIQAGVRAALGVPVIVAGSPAMSALAHSRQQGAGGTLMFLNVGFEVTAGIVIGDMPYTGHAGLAGQLGHVRVSDHGLPCRCGNRGCLDTVGSVPAMLAAYAAGHSPVTTQEFLARALAGDPAALRIVEAAAEALGLAAAAAASIINPGHVILGGPLCALGPQLLDPFRRSLVREAGPGIGDAADVSLNTLGADVAAVGAALCAAHRFTNF